MIIDSESKQWLTGFFGNKVKFDEPMKKHTSFRVGGPAKILAAPSKISDLEALVKKAIEKKWPYMIIGGGTNILVKDNGIKALVIDLKNCLKKIEVIEKVNNDIFVNAMAGATTTSLCNFALNNGFKGMNFALGIPGTVGGAMMMNAGTAQGDISKVLETITILNGKGSKKYLGKKDYNFIYRKLVFNNNIAKQGENCPVILNGCFKLKPGDRTTLKKEAAEILLKRKKNQPTNLPSAGCFFKNPESGKSAGELIEMAGLKGASKGDAMISPKHANFIINQGNASASDILNLVSLAQERVLKMFNQILTPEVIIVGE